MIFHPCYTIQAPFFLRWLVAFASHHRCHECGKVCWTWQNCFRPSDAYHQECFDKKYKEKNK